jgi:eukaryotic-like serine/threonine-protein kinase
MAAMAFEAGKKVGDWTLVSDVDAKLSAPLWVADDGERVGYVRNYRVRSVSVVQRLEKVAGMAKTFDHENVVPLRDLIEVPGGVAAISEYEEGQPLASILARARLTRKLMPNGVAVAIALDILEGLRSFGGRLTPAWVHGGIRPEAVLVTRGGRARLMDVGVAAEVSGADPLAQDVNWVAYAAPEHLASGGRPTSDSDVFSVGAILWEMLVGRRVFSGRNRAAVEKEMNKATDRTPASKHAAAALGAIVAQALELDPDERHEEQAELTNALSSACDDVADVGAVSEYVDSLQTVALDKRRRVLEGATGRAVPRSIPPAAGNKRSRPPTAASRPPMRMIEPPKIKRSTAPGPMVPKPPGMKRPVAAGKAAATPKPAATVQRAATPKPAATEEKPVATPKPAVAEDKPAPTPKPAQVEDKPVAEALAAAPESPTPDAVEPSSDDDATVQASTPPDPPAEAESAPEPPEAEPSMSEEVVFSMAGESEPPEAEPSMSEEVVFSMAGESEPPEAEPSMSEEVVFSTAGEPPLSQEVMFSDIGESDPPTSDEVVFSAEDVGDSDPSPASEDVPLSREDPPADSGAPDTEAPSTEPSVTASAAEAADDPAAAAGPAPAAKAPVAPAAAAVAAPAAAAKAPAALAPAALAPAALAPAALAPAAPRPLAPSLDLDDDLYPMKPPSKVPAFVAGVIVGALIVIAAHYGGMLPPP